MVEQLVSSGRLLLSSVLANCIAGGLSVGDTFKLGKRVSVGSMVWPWVPVALGDGVFIVRISLVALGIFGLKMAIANVVGCFGWSG